VVGGAGWFGLVTRVVRGLGCVWVPGFGVKGARLDTEECRS
jgi:hypothetical protein